MMMLPTMTTIRGLVRPNTTTTTHAAAADGEALDLSKAVSELSEGERAIFDALLGELSGQLVGKLDERLMAVE